MNIWTGLLFLDGSLPDVALARELAAETPASPSRSARGAPPATAEKKTMNLFKSLFYLSTTDAPEFVDDEPRYGAATAAAQFGRELGNHAASERWFGHHDFAYEESVVAAAGGR